MTAITASLVKELRERTNAPMMDCKKALVEANGDIEVAIEAMRKAGQAKAAKKAGRIAAEGMIASTLAADKKAGVILEANCETDFVARDDSFIAFVNETVNIALTEKSKDIDALAQAPSQNAATVDAAREALIAKIGENIQLRRLEQVQAQGQLTAYLHGGRIGVIVDVEGGDEQLAKDIAMHIAASNPLVISPAELGEEVLAKEREIYSAQVAESGKPADIMEKIVDGRMKKFTQEVSLLGQAFVKDTDKTVGDLLKQAGAKVHHFVRYAVGEGIEKKADNFAEEVMAQARA